MPDWRIALRGGLIYAGGDSIATLMTGEFLIQRALGIFLIGGTLYALEIPAYFRWIERRFGNSGRWNPLKKAVLAQAFFNPIWIARHLAFIKLFSSRWLEIDWQLLSLGLDSFLHIAPLGLLMNYVIQNRVPLNWRFLASASYSALMAVYLALSEVLFG
ncbi:MAG: hypothetical protein PHH11_09380 [Methylomonas sp.]|nr:hypothetical protein [Methylomonas sp.]